MWFVYAFCGVFCVAGFASCIHTLSGISKGKAIQNWPSAHARILSCDLRHELDSDDGQSFEVKVKYEYSIEGRVYRRTKLHPAYSASSFSGHEGLYEKLKSADTVLARYNPQEHSEAYLLTGSFSAHWAVFFAGLLFATMGLLFMLIFHFGVAGDSDYARSLEVVR